VSIRTNDTPSIGAVVPPDCFGGIALGSSLYPTEGYCLRVYSSSILSMLKIVIFFLNIFSYRAFLIVFFTSKNIYRVKYLITGILLKIAQIFNSFNSNDPD
jgi:hypothetical protein